MNSDERREIEELSRTLEGEVDALSPIERAKVVALLRKQFGAANEPISPSMEAAFTRFASGEAPYRQLQAQLGASLSRALFPRGKSGDV